jgi:thiol:disulfide interchange protein
VQKIEMRLDRDEFVVTYDPAQVEPARLITTIKETGYTARVVSGKGKASLSATALAVPRGFALLDDALAEAQREGKPVVLDFFAEWCAPCQRMEKTTFKDEKVIALLERFVLVRVDTDKHPDIAVRMAVEGLPDIRFVLPDGKVIKQLRNFQDAESFTSELEGLLRKIEKVSR